VTGHFNANAKQRLAKLLLNMSVGALCFAGSALVVLLLFGIAIMVRGNRSDLEAFVSSPLMVILFAAMSFIGVSTYVVSYTLSRDRRFDGVVLDSDRYHPITDVLHARGIRNTRRFIQAHPAHLQECLRLHRDDRMTHPQYRVDNIDAVAALVFISDNDPESTGEAIFNAIQTRGLKEAEQIKGLLESASSVTAPLMDGAL
jgi:hypothetical protein